MYEVFDEARSRSVGSDEPVEAAFAEALDFAEGIRNVLLTGLDPGGGLPYKKDWGARRTIKGLKCGENLGSTSLKSRTVRYDYEFQGIFYCNRQ